MSFCMVKLFKMLLSKWAWDNELSYSKVFLLDYICKYKKQICMT
uniref:Uncharacterized protein n=1 Tax=Arundo donax TaxID=35708 RepID=A0A0A9H2D0_ARUDO